MATYSEKVFTPKFRVGYERLIKGEKTDNGDLKYPMTMVFKAGEDLSALRGAVDAVIEEEWGKKAKGVKLPFIKHTAAGQDGERYCDKMEKLYEDDDDAYFVRAVSYQKVGLVDENVDPIIDPSDFYSGCYAAASIVAKTWENSGKKGVTFYVNNVQKQADGEKIGGSRSSPQQDFQPVEKAESAEDLFGEEDAA